MTSRDQYNKYCAAYDAAAEAGDAEAMGRLFTYSVAAYLWGT